MPTSLRRSALAAALVALLGAAGPALAASAPQQAAFERFVAGLRQDAIAAGIDAALFDAAFAGLTPDPRALAGAAAQPEFDRTIGAYVAARVTPGVVAQGRALAVRWKPWLDRIEAATGVDRGTILAIWAMESGYGRATGGADTLRALATLACCGGQRPDYFRGEVLAALKILQAHDIAPRAMTGSWAGALGQTQFMPSSFLAHAVDEDGDGRRDIWGSVPDVLGSIAAYLMHQGWERGVPWGVEVRLPKGFAFDAITRTEGAPAADWVRLGVTRADGGALPPAGKAWLLLPVGAGGPAFLTTANYWAIKTYNISDAYTTAVGVLGDRIEGRSLTAPWPAGVTLPSRRTIERMQRRLAALGIAVDSFDGRIGPATRRALRDWQTKAGLVADGFPTPETVAKLGAGG